MDSVVEINQDSSLNSQTTNTIISMLDHELCHATAGSYDGDIYTLSGSIHKVSSFLLKGNVDIDSITPKLVSIGPYHHGNQNLKEMEGAKLKYLRDLIHRASSNNLETYVRIIEQCASKAAAEFSSPPQQVDDFVRMMVADGCFVVEFMLKWFFNDRKNQASSIMTKLSVFKNDLLLVENQIPYFILEELFKVSEIPRLDKSRVSFTEIVLTFIMGDQMDAQFTAEHFKDHGVQFDHLLHLYHAALNSPPYRNGNWILSILFTYKSWRPRWVPIGVPNARNLRDAGFAFQKKYRPNYDFMDITRKGRNIMIPMFHINDSTLTNFQNLFAFENCSNKYGKNFTAYAMFLDYLLDSAEDVAILTECGIIDNRLGDDQKVADFFNKLCSGFDIRDEEHYLSPLFEYVSNYYGESRYRVKFYWWRKKYVPDYFKNPWAIPSMIAASVLLVLTVLQTFYTVYPYYHPRSN